MGKFSFNVRNMPRARLRASDAHGRSPTTQHRSPSKSPMKRSHDDSCRFTRELEKRLQNGLFILSFIDAFILLLSLLVGDISDEAKIAYDLLINGCPSSASSPPLAHEELSHCTSHTDLFVKTDEQANEINQESKPASLHHPTAVLFGSSSSSSTSISTSSTSNNTSSSSSSNRPKSDRHSHYSSTSTDNDISIDLKPQTDLSPLK